MAVLHLTWDNPGNLCHKHLAVSHLWKLMKKRTQTAATVTHQSVQKSSVSIISRQLLNTDEAHTPTSFFDSSTWVCNASLAYRSNSSCFFRRINASSICTHQSKAANASKKPWLRLHVIILLLTTHISNPTFWILTKDKKMRKKSHFCKRFQFWRNQPKLYWRL